MTKALINPDIGPTTPEQRLALWLEMVIAAPPD